MSTVRSAISSVRSAFKLISDDNIISDRFLASELKKTAYKLIKQNTDRRRLWASPNIFTALNCLEMTQVPLAECCNYTSNCTIARSKQKIPKIAEGIYGLLVQGVFSLDKKIKFKESTPTRYANILNLNLRQPDKFFWVYNGYLYITEPTVEMVTISAYFEEDVPVTLSACNTELCPTNPLDEEFKVPGYLEKDVVDIVYQTITQTYKRSKQDITSDNKDDSQ